MKGAGADETPAIQILMNTDSLCPGCHGRLQPWADLNEDEREVVRRLPGAREYSLTDRQRNHLWCTRCWHECPKPVSQA